METSLQVGSLDDNMRSGFQEVIQAVADGKAGLKVVLREIAKVSDCKQSVDMLGNTLNTG